MLSIDSPFGKGDRVRHITMNWNVYIILCSDDSLYTGITTDMERRFRQHAEGRGARYFRGRQPVRVVYLEEGHTRSTAGMREAAIKAASRAEKVLLVASNKEPSLSLKREPEQGRNHD
jgi:putative endonuclease